MNKPAHTPTPWNTDGQNIFYCPPKNHDSVDSDQHIAKVYVPTDSEGPEKEGIANAEYIVRAVNSHELLKNWIKDANSYVHRMYKNPDLTVADAKAVFETLMDGAAEAIAQAEGR